MKKESYYNLLNEYQELIKQKEFNSSFYNKGRLDVVKDTLRRQLTIFLRALENERYRVGYDISLIVMHGKISVLQQKIENDMQIEKTDYEDTFFELKICINSVFFTVDNLISIVKISLIATVIYIMIYILIH